MDNTDIQKLKYKYFSWSNLTLAMIALWTIATYLYKNGKKDIYAIIPAVFMSYVTVSYFVTAPECLGGIWTFLGIPGELSYLLGVHFGLIVAILFLINYLSYKRNKNFLGNIKKHVILYSGVEENKKF